MAWFDCGFYVIKSALNGFVLTLLDSNPNPIAALGMTPLEGSHGGLIQSRLNNFAVDIEGGVTTPATRLISYPVNDEHGSANQQWQWVSIPNTPCFLIKSKQGNLVIDVIQSNTAPNTPVIAYPLNSESGTPNQQWELVAVPLLETVAIDSQAMQIPSDHPLIAQFETAAPDEARKIQKIIALTMQMLQRRYPPQKIALRGVHAKDHGCVKASFTINADIPKQYQVGAFATPSKTYEAWVRFSNATISIDKDINKNPTTNANESSSRGMAIKLLNIEGSTLLANSSSEQEQDFLMINTPIFAFADVSEYLDLTQVQADNNDDITKLFTVKPLPPARLKTLQIVGKIKASPLGNPAEAQYFTASPFLFGHTAAAKFSVKPSNPEHTAVPENPTPNYLREALKKTLDVNTGKTVVFDFLVQLRSNDTLPIEDVTTEWNPDVAPFQAVATLTIEPQDFDTEERVKHCERLVFNPWHGLVEHQPLGGINRLRLGVYAASSKYRANS